jgi:hypothetical protein
MEIPNLVTDTFGNETTVDSKSGVALPLHNALMHYFGVAFAEMCQLDPLAEGSNTLHHFIFSFVISRRFSPFLVASHFSSLLMLYSFRLRKGWAIYLLVHRSTS